MNNVGAIMVLFIALAVVLGAIFAFPLMLIWNGCLVPAIPAIQEVTWLQMWGIYILISALFKTTVSKSD